jgi:hypothetical protein
MNGPSKMKFGSQVKIEGSTYGPLEVSTRHSNFLEDVKVHLVIQLAATECTVPMKQNLAGRSK